MSFLREHLNVSWLRPESALWDAIASEELSAFPPRESSLDLGCGNGLFSFITAGGAFGPGYDWFVHSKTAGFAENQDIYDVRLRNDPGRHITARPRWRFSFGFDHKANLLSQASRLGLYRGVRRGDANARLPFPDEAFGSVFSNILYWLRDPGKRLAEIRRVLVPGGRAILCVPDPRFIRVCESYQWRRRGSRLLQLINRGRSESVLWTVSRDGIKSLARRAALRVAHHSTYLSDAVLRFWDVGLRPLSPPLIEMSRRLRPADRAHVKALWIKASLPLLEAMQHAERRRRGPGGFHLVVLERPRR